MLSTFEDQFLEASLYNLSYIMEAQEVAEREYQYSNGKGQGMS